MANGRCSVCREFWVDCECTDLNLMADAIMIDWYNKADNIDMHCESRRQLSSAFISYRDAMIGLLKAMVDMRAESSVSQSAFGHRR